MISKLEKKFGRFAIKNLSIYIIVLYAVGDRVFVQASATTISEVFYEENHFFCACHCDDDNVLGGHFL